MVSFDKWLNESVLYKDIIPVESSLNIDDLKEYEGRPVYKKYEYFGDCKNTVDKDHIWDANQMSDWIYNKCSVLDINYVIYRITNGERRIPIKLLECIDKLMKRNLLDDVSKIVCGIDDYQKIMFIYVTETDTHYFFDCVI